MSRLKTPNIRSGGLDGDIPPAPPFVSLDEALGVIAYGQPIAFATAIEFRDAIMKRWGVWPDEEKPIRRNPIVLHLRKRLVLVWLRRRRWRWRPEMPQDDYGVRAYVRNLWHNEGKPSSRKMVCNLQADLRLYNRLWADYDIAAKIFINAVVDGHCVAFGRRGYASSRKFISITHEEIPKEVFANSLRGSLRDGWAAIDPTLAGDEENFGNHEIEFGDIKITRFDLEKLTSDIDSTERRRLRLLPHLPEATSRDELIRVFARTPGIPLPQPDMERYMFLDDAIALIIERLAIPEGPAVKRLLDLMREGHIRSYQRFLNHPTGCVKVSPNLWSGGDIDLDCFRVRGRSGLLFQSSRHHLHRFMIARDDFNYQMAPAPFLAKAESPTERKQLGSTTPSQPSDTPNVVAAVTLPPKRRGRKPDARSAVTDRMLADLSAGKVTPEQLRGDSEESLVITYGAGHKRDTCRLARKEALSQFVAKSNSNK